MLGSFCLFFFLFLLFAKFLPSISMTEIKEDIPAPRRPRQGALTHMASQNHA